jgi:hypothetical protein
MCLETIDIFRPPGNAFTAPGPSDHLGACLAPAVAATAIKTRLTPGLRGRSRTPYKTGDLNCGRGGTRTHYPRLRRPVLYPDELRARESGFIARAPRRRKLAESPEIGDRDRRNLCPCKPGDRLKTPAEALPQKNTPHPAYVAPQFQFWKCHVARCVCVYGTRFHVGVTFLTTAKLKLNN